MRRRVLIFPFMSICFFLLLSATASARGPILLGVSDTGAKEDYLSYTESLGRPVPLLQTFHTWGTSLNQASRRWNDLNVRPVLHISLNDEATGGAVMSLKDVALGQGDEYLLRLNQELADFGRLVLLRPLGEPNRPLNSYSAYLSSGVPRGSEYSPFYYRQAFRRIAIILRGGNLTTINNNLALLALPPLAADSTLARPRIKLFFSPLPSSLGIPGNEPGRFAPGERFYDGVGTSFFSAWPDERPLSRFYQKFSPGKMFYLLEWGLNSGRPRFVTQVYRWCKVRIRCKGMLFYQGFADTLYRLTNYPSALARVRFLSQNTLLYPLLSY